MSIVYDISVPFRSMHEDRVTAEVISPSGGHLLVSLNIRYRQRTPQRVTLAREMTVFSALRGSRSPSQG